MTFNLTNARAETRSRIQMSDTAVLSDTDLDVAIRAALAQYTFDSPNPTYAEFTGSGERSYALLTALPLFVIGWSVITSVEYPATAIATADEPDNLLDAAEDWKIIQDIVTSTLTYYLHFPNHLPLDTETVRVRYTGRHTLDGLDSATSTTIPAAHESAFYDLCACRALRFMATQSSYSHSPTVQADAVNYTDVSSRLARRADEYCASYSRQLGLSLTGAPPGDSHFVDWDTRMSWSVPFLFHHGPHR